MVYQPGTHWGRPVGGGAGRECWQPCVFTNKGATYRFEGGTRAFLPSLSRVSVCVLLCAWWVCRAVGLLLCVPGCCEAYGKVLNMCACVYISVSDFRYNTCLDLTHTHVIIFLDTLGHGRTWRGRCILVVLWLLGDAKLYVYVYYRFWSVLNRFDRMASIACLVMAVKRRSWWIPPDNLRPGVKFTFKFFFINDIEL